MLNPKLKEFDLDQISNARPDRDKLFMYLGIQTLEDRYLLRDRDKEQHVFELPQWMWMGDISMGLAQDEENKEKVFAINFYNVLFSHDFNFILTPTLFNSGTIHSQMSSCYVNTLDDSLGGILKFIPIMLT